MAPVTDFAVKEKYEYLNGFGNYHESEAIPGASPLVNNSPQKPPYGLRTERISGSSFTAPRHRNLQTWMYRTVSSLEHSEFVPLEEDKPVQLKAPTPNSCFWPSFAGSERADWISHKLLARNGDAGKKQGVAIWLYSVTKDMDQNTAFSSLDGDVLIIPQECIYYAGALDVQTELGKLLVRQNEFAVIPRGIRYRVTLPAGPARGYIAELHQGHFQLPELGAIGSTGLANVRDFQVPKDHTPFDVVAWHGTNYPFKYDLARFCVMGNSLFDEHDPSLYVVLTAPSSQEAAGAAVVDFAVIPPRWNVSEDTLWLPYFHRNTMSEFFGPIVAAQDPTHPLNAGGKRNEFFPFAAGLNGGMVAHGAAEEEFQAASSATLKPTKVQNDGMSIFLLETEKPLYLADWADAAAIKNFANPKPAVKI